MMTLPELHLLLDRLRFVLHDPDQDLTPESDYELALAIKSVRAAIEAAMIWPQVSNSGRNVGTTTVETVARPKPALDEPPKTVLRSGIGRGVGGPPRVTLRPPTDAPPVNHEADQAATDAMIGPQVRTDTAPKRVPG